MSDPVTTVTPAQSAVRASRPEGQAQAAIARAARATGVDFSYLLAQARIESGMNPRAEARTSSATGLFQFIDQTWLATLDRHGERLGLGHVAQAIETTGGQARVSDPGARAAILDLRYDPEVASLMAGALAGDNRTALLPVLGREPDAPELYLAHFLGADGAGRFLTALGQDPDGSAAALLPAPARANRAIFYHQSGAPRSLAQVMEVVLPVGIMTLIALMVMPIPALMLDIFFVLNIALSIGVLMVALNAKKPLDFSVFPSVLLFATCCGWRSTSPRPASCWSTATRARRPPAM
jgi:hypothetical protein